MTKVMLVEDDKSLREIYGVRLLAEGYDIVSAGDGEEALAMAIKERPQLIISDVMMPKISGFDMLDILRSTTETKNIRVIMMTALGSDDQRERGQQLGADRYLVKSQVGIEDVVRVVHEVLEDKPSTDNNQSTPQPQAQPENQNKTPETPPLQPSPPPANIATPPNSPSAPAQAPAPANQPPNTQHNSMPNVPPRPVAPPAPAPLSPTEKTSSTNPSIKTRVIQPLSDPTAHDETLNQKLDEELSKEAGINDSQRPEVVTTDQEKAIVDQQLSDFTSQPSLEQPAQPQDTPQISINPDNGSIQQSDSQEQPK